jgi:hypothetical protein
MPSRRFTIAQALKPALLYFALVFGAGFMLGPIRILWAVPRLGTRTAELLEMALMFIVMILSARWIVRRFEVPPVASARLAMGGVALALVLVTEFTIVLQLRGLTFSEYLATRDPVSGTVYYVMLGIFALLPWLVSRR